MDRFFDALNTPTAVLVVLVVVVAVNVFLYLGYHTSETSTPPPTEHSSGPSTTTIERTQQPAAPKERTRPATTLPSTIPAEQSVTPSASASATSSPSP